MKTQIVIHTLPYEIDHLERLLNQLNRCSKYLSTENDIITDIVLNFNLNNWEESKIPKDFFIDKFYQLEHITKTWSSTQFHIDDNNEILGCVSHRRKVFRETTADNVLLLDTDIFFSDSFLYHILNAALLVKEITPYFVLTPQITKMWDDSWDCLVNELFINNSTSEFKTLDPFITYDCLGEVNIKPINNIKFGGGWGTLISTKLLKKIDIPDSLGHYGLEDTYIMICSSILKQRGVNVIQYVLENELLIEDNKFRLNPYTKYLSSIDKREEFKKIAHENFHNELNKFGNSLNN
jgi:hypothetical protein